MRIRGETTAPEDPARRQVWQAITSQIDQVGSVGEFVSVDDVLRTTLSKHPWSLGGGVVAELKSKIEINRPALNSLRTEIGFASSRVRTTFLLRPQERTLGRQLPRPLLDLL